MAAVVGVVVYNRVQERATRREAERAFGSRHADVLLDEPHARREPTLEPPPQPASRPTGVQPDRKIDYVIELEGGSPAVIETHWAGLARRFGGRALLTEADGKLLASLQMLSRKGVVNEAELAEFRSLVKTLGAAHGSAVSAPEVGPALEAARSLDRTCAEVDVQIALHVIGAPASAVNGGPFDIAPRQDGVTLLLDLPRTQDPVASYEAMTRAARELAEAHGGRIVDDNGNALDERALGAIEAEVELVRARLVGIGVEPGSGLALRLFS